MNAPSLMRTTHVDPAAAPVQADDVPTAGDRGVDAAALALAPVRDSLRGFAGYSSARREASGGRIWLNANENPWPPDGDGGQALNRYPEPQPATLVAALAALYAVAPERVLAGRGSDELIDLLVRACCRAGQDCVLACPPTFGMYAVSARVQEAALVEVPLRADPARGPAPDLPAIERAIAERRPRIVFACSPNNPTGGAWTDRELATVAGLLAGHGLLVVDEAYAEFDRDAGGAVRSALPLQSAHPNIVVLRTLSKAHALAGARVGAAIGEPALLAVLRAIMAPYPLPAPSVAAALHALAPAAQARTRAQLALLLAERQRLAAALATQAGVRAVLPSRANFLCVRFGDAAAVFARLRDAGVLVRDVSRQPGLEGCLRISIGSVAENDDVLDLLAAPAATAVAEAVR